MTTSDSSASKSQVRRKRSTGFPVVSLADAAKVLSEAGKYGFEHTTSAFAQHMGHTTTNSGAFRQRLAAFRDWKLITGRGDTLYFTDVAKTIALPADEQARQSALQSAFMSCEVFAKLYDTAAKGQPMPPSGLGTTAVHQLQIASSAVERFATSFVESAVTAGLAEVEDGLVVLLEPGSSHDMADGFEPEAFEHRKQRADGVRGEVRKTQALPVVHQEWRLPAGAVVFEVLLDQPIPADVFGQLGAVVEKAEELATRLRELLAVPPDA